MGKQRTMESNEVFEMMNKQTQKALKMAIEVIEAFGRGCDCDDYFMDIASTIDACKEALEQPAQEPVAWTDKHNLFLEFDKEWLCDKAVCKDNEAIPLYTHPAPSWQGNKEFVGLSDDEIDKLYADWERGQTDYSNYAHAIEQALKEKNNAV